MDNFKLSKNEFHRRILIKVFEQYKNQILCSYEILLLLYNVIIFSLCKYMIFI